MVNNLVGQAGVRPVIAGHRAARQIADAVVHRLAGCTGIGHKAPPDRIVETEQTLHSLNTAASIPLRVSNSIPRSL
jgi:hypothetical protein